MLYFYSDHKSLTGFVTAIGKFSKTENMRGSEVGLV